MYVYRYGAPHQDPPAPTPAPPAPALERPPESVYAAPEHDATPILDTLDSCYEAYEASEAYGGNARYHATRGDGADSYDANARYHATRGDGADSYEADDAYGATRGELSDLGASVEPEPERLSPAPRPVFEGPRRHSETRTLTNEHYAHETSRADFRGYIGTWQTFEDREAKRAGRAAPKLAGMHVHYMDEREQDEHALDFEGGKATKRGTGEALHTIGASGVGTQLGLGQNRHIYTMSPDGGFTAAAAWDERKHKNAAAFADEAGLKGGTYGEDDVNLGFLNHSSLVGGGEVASAGELMVEDGEVRLVNDSSGHYRPDNEMLMQAVDQLAENGVDMDQLAVEFGRKRRDGPRSLSVRALEADAHRNEAYHSTQGIEDALRAKRKDREGLMEAIASGSARSAFDARNRPEQASTAEKIRRFERGGVANASRGPAREHARGEDGRVAALASLFEPVVEEEAPADDAGDGGNYYSDILYW